MAQFISTCSDETLSLEEAKLRLAMLDTTNADFIANASNILKGIYNNRSIFDSPLSEAIRNQNQGKTFFYSPQSFFIATGTFSCGSGFILRGNLWFAAKFENENRSMEDAVYSYENCHDHNFDFLTIGYSGPGYKTDLFRYEVDDVFGLTNEAVGLHPEGSAILGPSKVLYFARSRDVHTQLYPEEMSISINLLIQDREYIASSAQYEFDVARGTISQTIYSSSMHGVSLAYLAGKFGATEAAERLFSHFENSPMWQQRHAAGRAMHIAGGLPADHADAILGLPASASTSFDLSY